MLRLLLPAMVLLPLAMNAAAAYAAWRQTWSEAATEMARTADAAAEYARRLFDGLLLRLDRADDILAGLTDADIRAREPELHAALARASAGAPSDDHRAPYIFVYDREARPLVSGSVFPVPRGQSFMHREFNTALRGPGAPVLHVSPAYIGSVTGRSFFAVTRRRLETGNGLPQQDYDGVINASVDVEEASEGLRRLAGEARSDVLSLLRQDGVVLARSLRDANNVGRVAEGSPILAAFRRGEDRGLAGLVSSIDQVERLVAFRRVSGYPVYASAARRRTEVVAHWRRIVAGQLTVGLPATLALLGLAVLVRRRSRDLAASHAGLERRVAERTAELAESEARLRLAQEAGGVGLWDWELDSGRVFWSEQYFRVWNLDPAHIAPSFDSFLAALDPADRAPTAARLEATRRDPAQRSYEAEFRLPQPDGTVRWVLARGEILRDPKTGEALRLVGVCLDVTERRLSEDRLRLLAREVDHRAKNALAVVQAAVRLAPKHDAGAFAQAIDGRVRSLARVHSLLAEGRWTGTDLRGLAEGELAAFLPHAAGEAPGAIRAEIDGPSTWLGPAAAQALSMALHELATNAVKYGALSAEGGLVRLSWAVDGPAGLLRLCWAESGGPPLAAPPRHRGFGSRVLEGTVQGQLGGSVRQDWTAAGLVCRIEVPLDRLAQG
jgi:two-component sensor histidine kinase